MVSLEWGALPQDAGCDIDGRSAWKVDTMEGEKENDNQKEKTYAPPDEIAKFGSNCRVVNKMKRVTTWDNNKTFRKEYIAKAQREIPFLQAALPKHSHSPIQPYKSNRPYKNHQKFGNLGH